MTPMTQTTQMLATCPYCRAAFEPEDEVVTCPACGTVHHGDCLRDNGGCTVFGCSQAPVEEPRISVSSQDVARPNGTPAAANGNSAVAAPPPRLIPPPPPPRSSSSVPPPPRPDGAPDLVRIRSGYAATGPTFAFGGYVAAEPRPSANSIYVTRKSRVTFVLLAIFLGALGIHNFYAGYIKKAVVQCCLTVFTCFYGSPIVWIWAVVEACITSEDKDGIAFI